jgi:hypothetical protein
MKRRASEIKIRVSAISTAERIKLVRKLLSNLSETDVSAAVSSIEEQKVAVSSGRYRVLSAKHQKACGKVCKALISLRTAARQLPDYYRFSIDEDELKRLEKIYESLSERNPKAANFVGLEPKYRAINHGKRLAAELAVSLIERHNKKSKHTRIALATTRRGVWCTVAAVLYGEPTSDLSATCMAIRNSLKPWPKGASETPQQN